MARPKEGVVIYRFDSGEMKTFKIRKWYGNTAIMTDGSEMVWCEKYGFTLIK